MNIFENVNICWMPNGGNCS